MRMSKWTLAVAALALAPAAGGASAQDPVQEEPPAVTAEQRAAVDSLFAEYGPTTPGCAVAAVRDGRALLAQGYGMASLELGVPITPRTAFYAASVSKQFTAFAVALLAHDGRLSLGDDVRKWIPELPDLGRTITLDELLHHTSGLRDYFELLSLTGWPPDGPLTRAQFLDLVGRQRALNFAPGSRFMYSNTGYVLLALVVERASGEAFPRFAAERIFQPLGMTGTSFREDHRALVPNRANAYGPRSERGDGAWVLSEPGFDVAGDGGLYTTVQDLVRWSRNFYDHAVGGPEVAALVLTRGRLNGGAEIPYALGVTHGEYRGQRTVEHGGAYAGYRTYVLHLPDLRFDVVTLCNAATASPAALSRRVADVLVGERLGPRPATTLPARARAARLSPAQLARWAGGYWSEEAQSFRRFAVRDSTLAVSAGGDWVPLAPLAANRFAARVAPYAFTFSAPPEGDARVEEAELASDTVAYRRVPAWTPDSATLAAYVGAFHSDELDATVAITADGGALRLARRGAAPVRLEIAFEDTFVAPMGVLRFQRDGARRLAGFTFSAGRVKGLWFERGK